jgi:LysM repeat protein
MRRRSMLGFLLLNVLVSLAVVLLVINVINPQTGGGQPQQIVITVPILVTATIDPQATTPVLIVTATPRPGEPQQIDIPPGILDDPTAQARAIAANLTAAIAPTLDPAVLSAGRSDIQRTATALPPNCILYALKEGDFPSLIAQEYQVSVAALLEVNGLDENTARFLQIGQVLIVPLEGCPLVGQAERQTQTAAAILALTPTDTPTVTGTPPSPTFTPSTSPTPTATPTPTPTPTISATPTPTPTATLPPTAVNSQMQIVQVVNPGDVTAECVVIGNNGRTVDLNNWTLRDSEGDVYTFQGQFLVFERAQIRVCTGVGVDTPIVRYWGRQSAVWSSGETVILSDASGAAQAVFTIP